MSKRTFKQQISDTSLLPGKVRVVSRSGKEYPVLLSHELRQKLRDNEIDIKEGMWGIVSRTHGDFYLEDVEKDWGIDD